MFFPPALVVIALLLTAASSADAQSARSRPPAARASARKCSSPHQSLPRRRPPWLGRRPPHPRRPRPISDCSRSSRRCGLSPVVDARARGPRDVQTDFSIRGATFGQNLVLADGMRLNDSQSGHHNGEIPLPAIAIDRIEVVAGAGSAVHGADALGGTINVISRRGSARVASLAIGQHGLVDAQASVGGGLLPAAGRWPAGAAAAAASCSTATLRRAVLAIRGAPLGGLTRRRPASAPRVWRQWLLRQLPVEGMDRSDACCGALQQTRGHLDDDDPALVLRQPRRPLPLGHRPPGLCREPPPHECRRRASRMSRRRARPRRSGDRRARAAATASTRRISATTTTSACSGFAEWQAPLGSKTTTHGRRAGRRLLDLRPLGQPVRFARRQPLAEAPRPRVHGPRVPRADVYRALLFRPEHLGRADLRAERGWSARRRRRLDRAAWTASLSVFGAGTRTSSTSLRPAPGQRFQATNVRDVTTTGVEASVTRRWAVHWSACRTPVCASTRRR